MRKQLHFFLLIFLFAFQPGTLLGQDRLVVQRLSGSIEFDGRCEESAWNEISPLPMIMFAPVYGNQPSERTELKLTYDDTYIYMGAKLYDSQPEKMKIQLKRDDWKWECDWVHLILDTFNDKENTVVFGTSPSGGRTDVAFSNDATNLVYDMNVSWNTFWDVKTIANSEGWQAELRIPLSSLRFQEENGEVVMGVNATRYIPSKNESITMSHLPQKHGFWGNMKASQTREIVFSGLSSKNPVYLTPYVLGGLGQENILNEEGDSYELENTWERNAGLDLKYRITNNLTLDATVNQDFAQVEADNQQVNLTRFSLFFPEKRLFFQERKSNFDFGFDGYNRLFYTRRIGIYDGSPVGIYGGGRLVGRIGRNDVGFLSMQSAPVEDLLSENFSVLRLRRQVINPQTYVGGIITNRMDFKGEFNTAYGFDGIFNLFGDDYLKLMWAQTFEDGNSNEALSLDPSRIYINWERRTRQGISYDLRYSRAGADYNPGIGFERRTDYSLVDLALAYDWIYDNRWLKTQSIGIAGYRYGENLNQTTESVGMLLVWDIQSTAGMNAGINTELSYDRPPEEFELAEDVVIPAGDYTFYRVNANLSTARGKAYKISPSLETGTFYDGWMSSPGISTMFILRKKAELRLTYLYNVGNFPARDQHFTSHIFRMNTQLVFNTKLSVSAFVQYNSTIDAVLANFRLRYNPREGNDLYLVYDEGYNTDRYRELPMYPVSIRRTIMIKYTYTFVL